MQLFHRPRRLTGRASRSAARQDTGVRIESPQQDDGVRTESPPPDRGVSTIVWVLAAVLVAGLVGFALVIGPWLFTRFPHHGLSPDQALKAENDVRTTLVQAMGGLAVALGLVVTYRTYRENKRQQEVSKKQQDRVYQLSEKQLKLNKEQQDRNYQQSATQLELNKEQQDRDHELSKKQQERIYQLSLSQQVTDTYTKAIEQLGHTDAPVRLGAMYSLERLGQDNPNRRQTVVDVLCAYLRMPYVPPAAAEPESGSADPAEDHFYGQRHNPRQELLVRRTAQRLIADHTRCPDDIVDAKRELDTAARRVPSPEGQFWPGMALDLAGASLVDFSVYLAVISAADFSGALFTGLADFARVHFTGRAKFYGATFESVARFFRAKFKVGAAFPDAHFHDKAEFMGAEFYGGNYETAANFAEATFDEIAMFGGAIFCADAGFDCAAFKAKASFAKATFGATASFHDATFPASTHMGDFDGAVVLQPDVSREWPRGWILKPDSPDSGRVVDQAPCNGERLGRLVRKQPEGPYGVI